ncbi:lasso peptide biosynthesis B2 protein [Caulobacter sp. KR2-114]|uniref:lasso peptide biosynthesis B2 protein n=1 Tax=Caulobacter sp. KR2-114 TaxID=3400912 RepID=UPI003BFE9AC0
MRLFLASAVHAVDIAGDLVFLDVTTDAYFCLGGGGEVISLGPDGEAHVQQDETARQLLEAGLLSAEPTPGRLSLPPRPTASCRHLAARGRLPLKTWLAALAVTARVGWRFPRRSFADLLEGSADREALAEPQPQLIEAVEQFEQMRPWLPLQGECLLRSYHLRTFLRSRGFDALWVFGVRTWPFSAHCWLQVGHTALDEDLERLAAYSPIMVA